MVKAYEFLLEQDAKIVHPPEDGPWAPGYYSVLFEDPAGVRIELNHAATSSRINLPRLESEVTLSRTPAATSKVHRRTRGATVHDPARYKPRCSTARPAPAERGSMGTELLGRSRP